MAFPGNYSCFWTASFTVAVTSRCNFNRTSPLAFRTAYRLIRLRSQSVEDARRLAQRVMWSDYNNVRLNSAIGYITPKDMLAGHQQEIQAERDRKLDAAKEQRKNRRQGAA